MKKFSHWRLAWAGSTKGVHPNVQTILFLTQKVGNGPSWLFFGCWFLAKGQERNHISHPIQQKEPMNSWANRYKFWTWGDSLTKTTNWGDLLWGRYNLPRMTGLHQRQLVVSTCFRTHLKKNTLDPFCRKYLNLGLETKTTTISFLNYRQAKLGGTHFLQQQKLESSHPPRGLMVFILTFRCFFIVTVGKYIPNCQTVVKDGDVPW